MKKLIMLIGLVMATSLMVAQGQDTVSTAEAHFTAMVPAQIPKSNPGRQLNRGGKATPQPGRALAGTNPDNRRQSLWGIFLAGVAGGFAALFMPCIFPMLPFTVSFFSKQLQSRGGVIRTAMFYGISIILIYVVLGLSITILFGADALNSLATHGLFNGLFFLLLVAFAASFLGAFEISLPATWANQMDRHVGKGGWMGVFFMAATLSLISFSCTGPIIGTLLVEAAVSGALLGPAAGMFGFSLALALPFTLFAIFPATLQALPKSGGWLNSVKVVLGLLELALSLKFLSNVDLAYHWHWFDREVFLVLWIVIFGLMGMYLLGKLKFRHDSSATYISVTRLFLAILALAFTVYLVPGLWGAPLKSVAAFLPPMSTQDFNLNSVTAPAAGNTDDIVRKYAGLFDPPRGFHPFFDYAEGLTYARKMHKPALIDFTGHACVNCRKMEANVWADPSIAKVINEDFVLIQLYVDDKTALPRAEQRLTPDGTKIKTIGNQWSYLQISKFRANAQPFYVLLDPATQQPLVIPQGANFDISQYLAYLNSGLKAYRR